MSPTAIKLAKQSFNADTESIRGMSALAISAVALYSQAAFMEKRPPDFRQFRR